MCVVRINSVETMPAETICYGNGWLKKRRRLLLLYEVRRHIMTLIRMLRHVEVCDKKWVAETGWRSWAYDRRLRWRRLHLLLSDNLSLVRLLLLIGRICILSMAVRLLLVLRIPTPLRLEFCVYKANPPACLLTDLVKDLENFFLFSSIGETLTGDSKRA